MGSPLGLPMASVQVFSDDADEAGRPDPKTVIKTVAKKSNVPSPLHPEAYLPHFLFCTPFNFSCQVLLRVDSCGSIPKMDRSHGQAKPYLYNFSPRLALFLP
jgi:hypothetical protein